MSKQYPDWQTEIRKAQAEQQRRDEEAERYFETVRAAKQAVQDAEDAGNLKTALGWLGIEAEPSSSRWEMDGLAFTLNFFRAGQSWVHFSLTIRRQNEMTEDELASPDFAGLDYDFLSQTLDFSFDPQEWDWTPRRAEMADAIDRVNDGYEVFQRQLTQTRERLASRKSWNDRKAEIEAQPSVEMADEQMGTLLALDGAMRAWQQAAASWEQATKEAQALVALLMDEVGMLREALKVNTGEAVE